MTPIEAVARELYRRFLVGESGSFNGLNDEVDAHWQTWEGEARAALTALRDCGVTANYTTWPYDSYCEQPDRAWRAMLDAVLSDACLAAPDP